MFTADPAHRRPRPHRDRGAPSGWARSWSAGRSSPTPTSSPRTARALLEVRVGTKAFKIVRGAGRRATAASTSTTERGAHAGARRRRGAARSRGSALRGRAALRRAAGHRVGRSTDGQTWTRAVAADHHARRRRRAATDGRSRAVLVQRAGRVARRRVRARCGPAHARRTAHAARDGEVLVAPMTNPDWVPDHPPRGRAGHRQRRDDLPRRDRQPRARRARASSAPARATTVLRDGEVVTVDGAHGRGPRGPDVAAPARPPRRGRDRGRAPRRRVEPTRRPGSTSTSPCRPRRGGRGAAGRRRRPAARRVHAHRRARRRAPARS